MKIKTTLAATGRLLLTGTVTADDHAMFEDCNMAGLENMSDEHAAFVWRNRFGNRGKGNGGESFDILVDVVTGDLTLTCVDTEDEDTQGTIYVAPFGGGDLIEIGPIDEEETDPGKGKGRNRGDIEE